MLNARSFLAVDFGAATIKVAEFEINEAGGLVLRQWGNKSLGQEGTQEATREAAMLKGLQELLAEQRFSSREINVCAPGFHTFSKFVKLPPVDTSKVTQIIQYEAQQNVPFPLEEVVWDYQILGATGNELEVLLVAIKVDVVEGLFRMSEAAGLRTQLVDVSTAALCNGQPRTTLAGGASAACSANSARSRSRGVRSLRSRAVSICTGPSASDSSRSRYALTNASLLGKC